MATKQFTTINLAELAKRVPPNQREQFEAFRKKSYEYLRRFNKYPDKLPTIDWEYYRKNVRDDHVKLVEQFQVKYEELNHTFANRYETLDHSKYYTELEQLTAKTEDDVKKFVEDSIKRIQVYQDEIKRIENLPYENMTLEEFIELREDIAYFIPRQGKNLFWPHNPEEQIGQSDNKKNTGVENRKKIEEKQDVQKPI